MAALQSAATRTFGVNELLENILIQLSPLDLVYSRRVARRWKDNIDGSTAVQNTIYPEAEAPKAAWIMISSLWTEPLSEQTFGDRIEDCVRFSALNTRYSDSDYARNASFNRLLLQCPGGTKGSQILGYRIKCGEMLQFTEKACRVSFCDERSLSCDNMQLADVPVYDVNVLVECACDISHSEQTRKPGRWSGSLGRHHVLRMKDVREYVRKKCLRAWRVKILFREAGHGVEGRNQGLVFATEAEKDWVKKRLDLDL